MARPLVTPLHWVFCDPSQIFVIDDHSLAMMAEEDFEAQLDNQSNPEGKNRSAST
jgi:hypothetical protein